MKKLYILTFLSLSSLVFSQKIEKLFNEEKYAELTSLERESNNFTNQELYYLGFAFFRQENDLKAIDYYNKALEKGFDHSELFFQKGLSEIFLKKYDDALADFNTAISKNSMAEYYIEKARVYIITKDVLNEEKTYTEGLLKAQKKDDRWYLQLLKNAGNFYYTQTKNFSKSEKIYADGIAKFPKSYELYEKRIKALNAEDRFIEADGIFDQLQNLYAKKLLSEEYMKFKNVAVDEFSWNGQWINIYKSFEKPKEMLDSLYKVYLIDKTGEKVERKFNIEKTIQVEKKDPEFVICEEINNGHRTYPVGFKNGNFRITELRKEITKILNNKK